MVNLFADTLTPTPPLLTWHAQLGPNPADPPATSWTLVTGLETQQRRCLEKLHTRGVLWKNKNDSAASPAGVVFRLDHGGDVDADGNCLFTASRRAMGTKVEARELRQRTVRRFLVEYERFGAEEREGIDGVIRHLYSPDLKAGWGIHVVQEVKLLARKTDREGLNSAVQELVDLGIQRESAAESIYKERCVGVNDGGSWGKYMAISGSPEDEYDIITLQYTEEGLLTVDENRGGHAAAFGDDIAIESLATECQREIYVVQAHGSDAMVDEDNCVFFLPHWPRGEICGAPFFLFMKGTDCRVHTVFHVSLLKLYHGEVRSENLVPLQAPDAAHDGVKLVIVGRRMIKKNNYAEVQALLQWNLDYPDQAH